MPQYGFVATLELHRMNTIHPIAVSITDAGKMLSISRSGVYRFIEAGRIRPVQLGRRQLVPVSQLRELMGEPA